MNNTNETQGLKVLNVVPGLRAKDVNVNTSIDIEFSSDIDVGTLTKNIVVLEDINHIYETSRNARSLQDYSQFAVVKGSISYDNRVLTFVPEETFHTDACYIVILNNQIFDITGNQLLKKWISHFKTEEVASYGRCEIVEPKYGLISPSIPKFVWVNQEAESYIFQVSKTNTFESLLVDENIAGNQLSETISYTPSFEATDGIYHVRIKAENGEWSNVHQIFIKAITDAVVSHEDSSELKNFDDFLDGLEDPIEILEIFPKDGDTNIGLKTNVFYAKMNGRVDKDRIDLSSCYIYGESIDEEHEDYSHELVDGEWAYVYDVEKDVTYLIFTIYGNSTDSPSSPTRYVKYNVYEEGEDPNQEV